MQVVVAEGAPEYGGHKLARSLAEAGIDTTAIADSAIFAMMARVNKVTPCLPSHPPKTATNCLVVEICRSHKASVTTRG
jgi:hypothetical protein